MRTAFFSRAFFRSGKQFLADAFASLFCADNKACDTRNGGWIMQYGLPGDGNESDCHVIVYCQYNFIF